MTMIEVSGPVNVKKDKTKIQSQLKSTFRRKETKSCTAYNLGGVNLYAENGGQIRLLKIFGSAILV